jgi:hypothetical protein
MENIMQNLIIRARRALQQKRQLLGFLHIPKTAGTSLVQALTENFTPNRVMPSEYVYDLQNHDVYDLQQKYDLLHGHVGMDVLALTATQIVTLVREPTDRIISLYNYWRAVPIESATVFEGGLIDPGVTLAKELSFRDFVECGHQRILNDIENGQSFQIAGSNGDAGRQSLCDRSEDEIFTLCQSNLASMVASGVTDNLNHFVHELKLHTGIALNIPNHNVTLNQEITREALPDDLLRYIQRINVLDYRVYEALRKKAS